VVVAIPFMAIVVVVAVEAAVVGTVPVIGV
jgi:hypothetical protein